MMNHYEEHRNLELAGAKVGVCRQTAAKYVNSGILPSEAAQPRNYRTRTNPFAEVWPMVIAKLKLTPELRAKELYDWVCEQYPGEFSPGQLRTFQRHVRKWRALDGPEKVASCPQVHPPGKRMSLDFTDAAELGITIAGEPFPHKLGHCTLTHSNWCWASIVLSESLPAVKLTLQDALVRLGRVPEELWMDNSTAATHKPGQKQARDELAPVAPENEGRMREFNTGFLELVRHFGITPRTINIGKSNENGDIESQNGHLKACLNQHLLLRGSRDFESVEAYRRFLNQVLLRRNAQRGDVFTDELKAMKVLRAKRLPEYRVETPVVSAGSTVQVSSNTYSVPSRLIGQRLHARVHDAHVDIYYSGKFQVRAPRLIGRGHHHVDYRHVIGSLLRKPGAFANYRYRDAMFPTVTFRRAFDQLEGTCSSRTAVHDYLRILALAADGRQSEVNTVLDDLLVAKTVPRWATVEEFLPRAEPVAVPEIAPLVPDLISYDVHLPELSS